MTLRPNRWQSFNLRRSQTWTNSSWHRVFTWAWQKKTVLLNCLTNDGNCMQVNIENRRKQHFPDWQMFALVLTLTITLRVSSLGKKTQTQRRSCMVLLLWKFSLFIFVWLGQDRRLCLQMGLWAHRYHQQRASPRSAAVLNRSTSDGGLSRPRSTHRAKHGDPSCRAAET